ncbi:uncharacterized protein TNCV_1263441 [Trichonephila clavipes]|nr:uncharacterized protein TNCV_1263441 [Trichonephila clavipes]
MVMTWTIPELASPFLTTTPHQRENVSALDRFNVHRCPTRRVFSVTGLELVTRQATVRYLYHSAIAAAPNSRGNNIRPTVIEYIMRKRKCRNHWRNYQVDFSLLNDTFK